MQLGHWIQVAIKSGHPILGFCHDLVEDGYMPQWVLRYWPALDAITRRDNETYTQYIERVAANRKAAAVKRADLRHNLHRNGGCRGSLRLRYMAALARLNLRYE